MTPMAELGPVLFAYDGSDLAKLAIDQPHGPNFVRHYLTNHVIEPFAGQAIGKQYLVVLDIPNAEQRAKGIPGSVFLGGPLYRAQSIELVDREAK